MACGPFSASAVAAVDLRVVKTDYQPNSSNWRS